jgi:hypothetical protein
MKNVSESPYGFSESYTVRFWYTDENGMYKQIEEILWANDKSSPDEIEQYAMKNFSKFYKNFKLIAISHL